MVPLEVLNFLIVVTSGGVLPLEVVVGPPLEVVHSYVFVVPPLEVVLASRLVAEPVRLVYGPYVSLCPESLVL